MALALASERTQRLRGRKDRRVLPLLKGDRIPVLAFGAGGVQRPRQRLAKWRNECEWLFYPPALTAGQLPMTFCHIFVVLQ